MTTVPKSFSIVRLEPLRYLPQFSGEFSAEMELFIEAGIHPESSSAVLDPVTGTMVEADFYNIGEHCLAAAHVARRIGEHFLEQGRISAADLHTITRRALLHDISKPFAILARRHGYTERGEEELRSFIAEALERHGASPALVEVIRTCGTEAGHGSLGQFLTMTNVSLNLNDGRLVEKIIHLADAMVCTTHDSSTIASTYVLPTRERLLAGGHLEKYPFLWTDGLTFRAPSGQRELFYSFAELSEFVAEAIALELLALMGVSGIRDPQRTLIGHLGLTAPVSLQSSRIGNA